MVSQCFLAATASRGPHWSPPVVLNATRNNESTTVLVHCSHALACGSSQGRPFATLCDTTTCFLAATASWGVNSLCLSGCQLTLRFVQVTVDHVTLLEFSCTTAVFYMTKVRQTKQPARHAGLKSPCANVKKVTQPHKHTVEE